MLRNTQSSWGVVARVFHWGLALLIVGLFAYGLWMKEFPAREDRAYHYVIHASVGISILALMVLRVVWRAMNPTPLPPAGSENWEIRAASLGHLGLYAAVFGTTLAGWFLAGSGKRELYFYLFGAVPMTTPLGTESPYHGFLEEAHELLAYGVIALVVVHVAAAIWHQRVKRDGLMARMTSGKASATI